MPRIARHRRTKAVAAVLLVGAAAGGGAYAGQAGWFAGLGDIGDSLGQEPAHAQPTPSLPAATTEVTEQTLVRTEQVDGVLGYGDPRSLDAGGQGVLTELAAEGSRVRRGESAYRLDDRPIPLLYGDLPLYRPLAEGVEDGPDVRQLERNLRELGYGDDEFEPDQEFTAETAEMVEAWQDDLGLDETGRVEPGQVVIAPAAIRVDAHQAEVGDRTAPGQPVLGYTGTERLVTIDLEVEDRELAREGDEVSVTLPDGETIEGSIASVSAAAEAPADQQDPASGEEADPTDSTVEVVVELASPANDENSDTDSSDSTDSSNSEESTESADEEDGKAEAGALDPRFDQAPVSVELRGEERADVLTVPIMALLALSEGGYGVEVVDDGAVETVPVELGMFADGRVEVSGEGITEGVRVGVPE